MRAFEEFAHMSPEFWAFVGFVSQMKGYTVRKKGVIRTYTATEIRKLCKKMKVMADDETVNNVVHYSEMRAERLNGYVRSMLMDVDTAREEYRKLYQLHKKEAYKCNLPMNKQKGDMKEKAFFTSIINILAERTIRETGVKDAMPGFVDNPQKMIYLLDEDKHLVGGSSRRFDGAYPGIESPKMVWEIKEYYYNKSFGSRIADGVYETQLDGFELNEIYKRTNQRVYHVLFIDSYKTWWELGGRSYLCRLVDALNMGLVDEVIVGKEVFCRWPELLRTIAGNYILTPR